MNWFRQNRFLGSFLATLTFATTLLACFLVREKNAADNQATRLEIALNEMARLRHCAPFPSPKNLAKTSAQTSSYRASLNTLEDAVRARTLPVVMLQPNEFQAQLRQSVNSVTENARLSKVPLPADFHLGFDEYTSSLPNSAATAALLARELKAIETLANIIVGARVDSLDNFARAPLRQEKIAAPAPAPAKRRGPKSPGTGAAAARIVEANAIDLSFSASPAAARKVLNQIASAPEELFVIRALVVKNQVDKGPKREPARDGATLALSSSSRNALATPAVTFIVGNEHLYVAAKLELVSLTLNEKENR